MNTKMLEKIAFLQCRLCRGYLYVGMPQDIRSISSHMYYYIVVLNSLAKFTGTHRDRSLFSTCSLQLHWKRNAVIYIYIFLLVLRNFLGKHLLRKTSCKLVLKVGFYEKWWTDILIIIKRCCESTALSNNRLCNGQCIFENHRQKVDIELNNNFQPLHRYLFAKVCY